MTQAADNIPKTNAVDAARLILEHGAALGPNGIAVSLHLLALTDESGRVEQTPQQIADAIGSSRMTVIRTLARLEQMRHVTKAKATGATYTSVWQLSAAYLNLVYTNLAYTSGIQEPVESDPAYTNGVQADAKLVQAPVAPIEPISRAGARSNRKPLEEKKKEETRVVGSGKGKNGASAPAGAPPDRTAEDSKREEFLAWLAGQPEAYRQLFDYAAPAMGAPPATTSSRKRAEAASVVRMLLADGADVELFKAVRAAYSADPWRNRETGRAIPLNPAILRDRWAELAARVREAGEETGGAEVVPIHETPVQRRAREDRERAEAILRRLEQEQDDAESDEGGGGAMGGRVDADLGGPGRRLSPLETYGEGLRVVR
jgi:hypothetical protein